MILDSSFGNLAVDKIYLGNQLLFNRYDISTELLLDTARDKGFTLPNNRMAVDFLIRGLKRIEMFYLLDNFLLFASDLNDKVNFRMLNVVNPLKHQATPYGGLLWTSKGVKGNGANGYIDTNYNPAIDHVIYELDNACFGGVISYYDESQLANGSNNFIGSKDSDHGTFFITNSTAHRINQGGATSIAMNNRNTGLQILQRVNNREIEIISKDLRISRNVSSTIIDESNKFIFCRNSKLYSDIESQCVFIGASIPYEMAQQFRILFNEYLTMLNLNPIA